MKDIKKELRRSFVEDPAERALALVSPGFTRTAKFEGIVFGRAIISRESGIEDINQLLIINIYPLTSYLWSPDKSKPPRENRLRIILWLQIVTDLRHISR